MSQHLTILFWGSISCNTLQEEREIAYWLRGVMQLCIYPPLPKHRSNTSHVSDELHRGTTDESGKAKYPPLAWSCSEEAILDTLRERDPSGKGLPGPMALRLVQVGFSLPVLVLLYPKCCISYIRPFSFSLRIHEGAWSCCKSPRVVASDCFGRLRSKCALHGSCKQS